jgi:hypothetical protein
MSMYGGVRLHALRGFVVCLAAFLAVSFAGAASAAGNGNGNGGSVDAHGAGHLAVLICHWSADEGVYERITPDNDGVLNGHENHADDEIVDPEEACPDAPAGADPGDPEDEELEEDPVPPAKVTVCHVTAGLVGAIEVDVADQAEHLAHGDTLPVDGECAQPVVDEVVDDPVVDEDDAAEEIQGDETGSGGRKSGLVKPGADKPLKRGKPVKRVDDDPVVRGVQRERSARHHGEENRGHDRLGAEILPAAESRNRVNRPAAVVLPATGAADHLGPLGAVGLGLVVLGGLTMTARRRSVYVRG